MSYDTSIRIQIFKPTTCVQKVPAKKRGSSIEKQAKLPKAKALVQQLHDLERSPVCQTGWICASDAPLAEREEGQGSPT